jgi:hypothetical protein
MMKYELNLLTLGVLMRTLVLLAVVISIAGCATVSPSIPESYTGPKATLLDTGSIEDGSKAKVFAALEIDGKPIQNSLRETRMASQGRGLSLSPRITAREIPAQALKLKLTGTHITAAPIHELASRAAGTFFSVDGEVAFKPEAGRNYAVVGELSKDKSCVWIEDRLSNAPATEKVCTK